MGHHHLTRIDQHPGVTHTNGYLPAQWLEARTEHVTEGARAVKARHFGQLLMQSPHRQIVNVRDCRTKGENSVSSRLGQHLLDDARTSDQARPLDPGDIRVCAVSAGVWCT